MPGTSISGTTATDLQTALNALFAGDTTMQINSLQFIARDQLTSQGIEMAVGVNYTTGGVDLGVSPFLALVFTAPSIANLAAQIATWEAANPGVFMRGPYFDDLGQRRRLNDYVAIIIYSASADAAANWFAGGAGALSAVVSLADAASITPDFAEGLHFETAPLTQAFTFENPDNPQPGQDGTITFVQDAVGSRVVTWGANYQGAGGALPVLTAAVASAVDIIHYHVKSATEIVVWADALNIS